MVVMLSLVNERLVHEEDQFLFEARIEQHHVSMKTDRSRNILEN